VLLFTFVYLQAFLRKVEEVFMNTAKPGHVNLYRLAGLLCIALIALILLPVNDTCCRQQPGLPDTTQASHIVQSESAEQAAALVTAAGGTVTSQLSIINGVGAVLSETAVAALREHGKITAVVPNATVRVAHDAFLNPSATLLQEEEQEVGTGEHNIVVGAPQVWQEGITGRGITVAIVDTGLDQNLPGLRQDTNHNNRPIIWQDFVDDGNVPPNMPIDPNGHGSHIAGIIGDSRTGSGGLWNGIAPDVNFIGVRVLGETGMGTYESVIQGIQWVVANRETYDIQIMNLSLVATPQSPYWADPLNQAVMQAWADGLVVVVAAGNSGPLPMSITVPGNVPYVITVGALTDNYTPEDWYDDYIPPFSAAGPTLDAFVKPDVIAPGAHMVSTMRSSAYIAQKHQANKISGTYFSMAGTSQATAVVSGISALMLEHNPDLTPDEVKYRLTHTALLWIDEETHEVPYSVWQQGMGRVNAPDAVLDEEIEGVANYGLDIMLDIAEPNGGYQGHTYYDEESGEFRLLNDPGTWPAGFGAWAGGFGAWAGGFGAWAGGFGAWAGGFGAWAGSDSTWAGGFGAWAGGFGAWAGGYTTWAGGFGAWAGSVPWAGRYDDQSFVESYEDGESPNPIETTMQVDDWVEEMDWINLRSIYLPLVMH
jgi:serine protease AprX